RQRRNRLVVAASWEREALLQRRRGRRHARGRMAALPVPRPGEDHPVLDRDEDVREVHGADRGRGALDVSRRAVVLIDGEHYGPVVRDALAALPYEIVGALLVGGTEKLRGDDDYGVPLVAALDAVDADLVVDLSDEPVLGPRERMLWASRTLALGLPYVGADFRFDPPPLDPVATPSLAVIGLGKRIGKTAVAGHAARLLGRGPPAVVAG